MTWYGSIVEHPWSLVMTGLVTNAVLEQHQGDGCRDRTDVSKTGSHDLDGNQRDESDDQCGCVDI